MNTVSFTTKSEKKRNVLSNNVSIGKAFAPGQQSADPVKEYTAIWDTGATNVVITKKVVEDLSLIPIDKTTVVTGGGKVLSDVFLISVFLPNRVVFHALRATVAVGEITGADVLIGMDIINQGDFAISNYSGRTTFSFRMPSIEETDYNLSQKQKPVSAFPTPGRNQLCPCGSGKKYKNCCIGKTMSTTVAR